MKILLVIDLQKEFKGEEYPKCVEFVHNHQKDYYVIATLFKNDISSMYEKHLNWSECRNSNGSSLEYPYDKLVVKNGYFSNDLIPLIKSLNSKEVHIVGCDVDACVLATAFALWDNGIEFKILSEYTYTTATEYSKEDILKILRRNFGDCVEGGDD